MKIAQGLGNAAGVAATPINASATVAAGGSGGLSVFAGVVFSTKGKPFSLIRVSSQDWIEKLGAPLRPNEGAHAGSLRCLEEALVGGDGYVVRVVPKTAKYPVIKVQAVNVDSGKNVTAATAVAYGQKPTLDAGDLFALYPTDGSAGSRSISIAPVAAEPGMFTLSLFASNTVSGEYLEGSWKVSFNPAATDAESGKSVFITDVLARTNAVLSCEVAPGTDLVGVIASVDKTALVGATGGEYKDIAQDDWVKAVSVLSNAMVGYTAVVGLGVTDGAVIELLAAAAKARRIDAFADVAANSYADAVSAAAGLGLDHEHLALYFFPYNTKDAHYGVHAHWGISGVAFSAKAKGVAKVRGGVGGWHYSPAGVERGTIPRKEPVPFEGLDAPDEEALYKARINKLGLTAGGLLMIDDAITTRQKEDNLRFQHVASVMNAITRDFYALAKQLQHEPDGVTESGLAKGMRSILDDYVASEALVKPKDVEEYGEEPYTLIVKKTAFDMWSVQWACCVTGTSRRILGEPALIPS